MCGINGFNFVDRKLLKKMNDSIKHRGPDAGGEYFSNAVSLGHRRLAIIDLTEKGAQPMKYNNLGKEVWIVFNGEIYNFLEIRDELIKKGYTFKSECDTEVILASYLEWGENCVKKFNGMWAFCIYDLYKKRLFLSRDRLGKKPLYYFFDGQKFIFSSEIKGIISHNPLLSINSQGIDFLLTIGFIPSPYSIYSEIKKLSPRNSLIFDLENKTLNILEYFQIPEYSPKKYKKDIIKKIRNLLGDSTKKRLIADVPVGAFLSGGIDSSLIVSQMANFLNLKKLNTFSIGFDGKFDESKYSRIMKEYLGTNHHHKYFTKKEFLKTLPKIPKYYDEPLADVSCYPTFFVSELARKYVTVSLSGDGGDEIFGGYPAYKLPYIIQKYRLLSETTKKIIQNLLNFSKIKKIKKIKKIISLANEKNEEIAVKILSMNQYVPNSVETWMKEKYRLILAKTNDLTESFIRFDLYYGTLADNFLVKVDRASMAHALEVRSPLLDHRFLQIESEIESSQKVNLFYTKILMKEAIKYLLPSSILHRKKQGFIPPMIDWIDESPIKQRLNKNYARMVKKGIISPEWQKYYTENTQNKTLKMRMFMLGEWYSYWEKRIFKS